MDANTYRLLMSGFWLVMGLSLLFRHWVGLEWVEQFIQGDNLNLLIAFSFAFFLFNMIRWWLRRPRPTIRYLLESELERKDRQRDREMLPSESSKPEYNPELDFSRPENPSRPG